MTGLFLVRFHEDFCELCRVQEDSCAFLLNCCGVNLKPGLLAHGAMGKIEEMVTAFVDVLSVIKVFFGFDFVTVKRHSHFHEYSEKTQTWAFGDMTSLSAAGSFVFRALVIRCSVTTFSISNFWS